MLCQLSYIHHTAFAVLPRQGVETAARPSSRSAWSMQPVFLLFCAALADALCLNLGPLTKDARQRANKGRRTQKKAPRQNGNLAGGLSGDVAAAETLGPPVSAQPSVP